MNTRWTLVWTYTLVPSPQLTVNASFTITPTDTTNAGGRDFNDVPSVATS